MTVVCVDLRIYKEEGITWIHRHVEIMTNNWSEFFSRLKKHKRTIYGQLFTRAFSPSTVTPHLFRSMVNIRFSEVSERKNLISRKTNSPCYFLQKGSFVRVDSFNRRGEGRGDKVNWKIFELDERAFSNSIHYQQYTILKRTIDKYI